MAKHYEPIVADVTMSKYGYWVVTYSLAPGLRMQVMIAKVGITRDEAADLGFASVSPTPIPGRWQ